MILRLLAAVVLFAAEMATATALLVVAPAPADAQRFEDFFPFFQQRTTRMVRSARAGGAPCGLVKAPVPKKADAIPQTPIMVFGVSSRPSPIARKSESCAVTAPRPG